MLYAINLIDIVVGSMLYAFVPDFIGDVAYKSIWISAVFIIYKICQIGASPFLGHLADMYGSKAIFRIMAYVTFFSNLFLIPKNVVGLFANRVSDGMTNSYYQNSQALLKRTLPASQVPVYLGYLESITSIGILLGGGLVATMIWLFQGTSWHHLDIIICMSIFLSLVNVILVSLLSDTSVRTVSRVRFAWPDVRQGYRYISTIRRTNPELFRMLLVSMAIHAASCFYVYLVIYLTQGALQVSTIALNLIVLVIGVVGLVANTVFFKWVYPRIDHYYFFLFALIVECVLLGILALIPLSLTQVVVLLLLDSVTFGLCFGLLSGYIARVTPQQDSGKVFGVVQSASELSTLSGMFIFTVLAMYDLRYPFVFFAMCVVVAIAYSVKNGSKSSAA